MRRAIPFLMGAAIAVVLGASLATPADELKLKDGTKITGTIVGFEENSFRVQTAYGFAIVQKDQVVAITISGATKAAAETAPGAAKRAKSEKASAPAPQPPPPAPQKISAAAPPPTAPAAPATTKSAAQPAAAPTKPTPPAQPAAPEPIHEEVSGNTYINETYGFRMYKPPDWEVISGARTVLPGAIAAMGTEDDTTYLLIGQQPAGKSLADDISAAEKRLAGVMDNFRPLGETRITVSGGEATEFRFRGGVDQQDWSGTAVFIPRGARLYTIFGMTLADTDLVQIQENVIVRAISSLQFTSR
ncbi:MAG: hypothetical protein WA175_04470 [Candidatus Acidiferrales bacterium]